MSAELGNTTVLITGASGNVGWGIAHAAQDAGANVVLPTRSEEARAALAGELGDERALVANVDFTSVDALERLRDEALDRFGALDHVVAPLGAWWQKGASLDQPPGELRGLLDAYVEAQWRLLKAVAPALRASRGSYTFITGAAGEAAQHPRRRAAGRRRKRAVRAVACAAPRACPRVIPRERGPIRHPHRAQGASRRDSVAPSGRGGARGIARGHARSALSARPRRPPGDRPNG